MRRKTYKKHLNQGSPSLIVNHEINKNQREKSEDRLSALSPTPQEQLIKFYKSTPNEFHTLPQHVPEPYIMSSYRVNLTFKEALFSLFSLHNETMNIWTSLISMITFSILLYRVCYVWEMDDPYHRLSYVVFCLGAVYTYGASTIYHWFNCISFGHHQTLLRIDVSGIGMLILGCFYPPIYYSFHCHPYWGLFYIVAATVGCIIASVIFLVPKYTTDTYRFFRICIFICICSIAILPTIHLFMIYGIENAMFIETSSGVAQTAAMCAIGLLFYATKIPERFYPGRFDIALHSHQFWHSTIFVAMLVHLRNMLRVMATFDTHPCYGMKGSFYVDDAPSHFHSSH